MLCDEDKAFATQEHEILQKTKISLIFNILIYVSVVFCVGIGSNS